MTTALVQGHFEQSVEGSCDWRKQWAPANHSNHNLCGCLFILWQAVKRRGESGDSTEDERDNVSLVVDKDVGIAFLQKGLFVERMRSSEFFFEVWDGSTGRLSAHE